MSRKTWKKFTAPKTPIIILNSIKNKLGCLPIHRRYASNHLKFVTIRVATCFNQPHEIG